MSVPQMPWYSKLEEILQPLDPYMTGVLLAMALITILIALKGSNVLKWAWFIYWVSP